MMRKKVIAALLALACLGCVDACDKEKAGTDSEESAYLFYPEQGSENGIYYLRQQQGEDQLAFYDYETGKNAVLCMKSNCTHENSDCDAIRLLHYKENTVLNRPPTYYEGKLYFVYTSTGEAASAGKTYICRTQEDGSAREELWELTDVIAGQGVFYKGRLYLSAEASVYNEEDKSYEISDTPRFYCLYLETGKSEELTSGKKQQRLQALGARKDSGELLALLYTPQGNHLVQIDEENEITLIKEDFIDDWNFLEYKGELYRVDNDTFMLMRYDLQAGTWEEHMQLPKQKGRVSVLQGASFGIAEAWLVGEQRKEDGAYERLGVLRIDINDNTYKEIADEAVAPYKDGYIVRQKDGTLSYLRT